MNNYNSIDWIIIVVSVLFSLSGFYVVLIQYILYKKENRYKKIKYRSWEEPQLILALVNNEREYNNQEFKNNRELAKFTIELDAKNNKLWTI